MAKTQFSSKIGSSLALRVFLVCLTFLILPLSIYSIYLLYQEEGTRLFSHLLILIILMATFGGATAIFLIWKMSRPLKHLHFIMRKVGLGETHLRYHQDKWGFEINELGTDFNQMIESLLLHMEMARNEKMAREIAEQELKIGHEIQKSLFPKALPRMHEIELGTYFAPAQKISGDFYDLFTTADGKLLIVMADVAGKGISACLYSFLFRNILRSLIVQETSLSKMIPLANHLFKLDVEESSNFITAWIGLYDPKSHVLEYGCFGHPPALLLHQDRTVEELGFSDIALGIKEMGQGKTSFLHLKPHDLLLLYTDGILEAMNSREELYGKEKFIRAVQSAQLTNPNALVGKLAADIQHFCGNEPLHDDLTLLALEVRHKS